MAYMYDDLPLVGQKSIGVARSRRYPWPWTVEDAMTDDKMKSIGVARSRRYQWPWAVEGVTTMTEMTTTTITMMGATTITMMTTSMR